MNITEKPNLMVVHLYGVYSPERQDYAQYLDWVAQQIAQTEVEAVVLCGGHTVPNLPDISEASSAQQYLSQKVGDVDWLLEDSSFTTYQNSRNAAKLLQSSNSHPEKIHVLCDHARQAKVIWLALTLLLAQDKKLAYQALIQHNSLADYNRPFTFEKLTVSTFDYQPKLSTEALRQTYSALIDALPVYDPSLDEIATKQRRHDFGFES